MGNANSVSIARSEEEENPSVNQRESESKTLSEESVSLAKSKEEDPSKNSVTEADEEEIEECGLCKFIKNGDCKEQWIAVEKCVDEDEEESDDTRCKEVRMMFKTCIFDNPVYYEPIISAQAQIVAKMLSKLHAEKEALLAGEAAAIAKALSKLQTDKEQPINILPAEAAAIAKTFSDLEDGKMEEEEEKEAKIVHHAEHSSPSVNHLTPDMIELSDLLLSLGMDDLRYYGCNHTWTNYQLDDPITKKLDRALVNDKWLQDFPSSMASFLPPEFSDHSPCIIKIASQIPSSGSRPFKYQNFISTLPNFLITIEAAWCQVGAMIASDLSALGYKLKQLKTTIKSLSKENFSDIENRVKEINILLKEAQIQALDNPSPDSFQSERSLHTKWNYLRSIEEAFFKIKSRINWLKVGDNNTPFFHRVAASRQSYNSIRYLILENGLPISGSEEISQVAISHFMSILAPQYLPMINSPLQWFLDLQPFRCSAIHMQTLSSIPSDAEITRVLMKLNPTKAPGPDGYTSAFFKSAWPIVGSEVLALINRFFTTGFLPLSTNATILTLVPEVILPNQTAFVKGRLLFENTLLASMLC